MARVLSYSYRKVGRVLSKVNRRESRRARARVQPLENIDWEQVVMRRVAPARDVYRQVSRDGYACTTSWSGSPR